jgi:hypothetical protein
MESRYLSINWREIVGGSKRCFDVLVVEVVQAG